ncbi:uncharacterized protein BDW43DRAFT_306831 [Aspergillus alliaceus]|uniref:uncharacterized protein n=1 Tax=Petromyces alliaceus TaxID=209559 RepID=UPI0012A56EB5|nr:uncharacterized protein BDW43DRAFT_306831 [Aspergillus alliaceus]KAB8238141.1 hypothetical protein BDW43DRAFT_306831 [Aspergillus alliaceus]
METLLSYGVTYLATNNSTLATLVAAFYGLFLKRAPQRLTIRAVILCQSSGPPLAESDINEFLQYDGPAKEAINITIEHESMLYDDSLRDLPIRDICRKLAGLHSFKGHCLRIVPERASEDIDEVGQLFGCCLILMHLKEFYENYLDIAPSHGGPNMNEVSRHLQRFNKEFGPYISILPNDQTVEIVRGFDDPRLEEMFNMLIKRNRRNTLRRT